jgi:hypothetical protein
VCILVPRKNVTRRRKTKATFVFLKVEKNVQAHMRQTTIAAIPTAKEGDRKKDRRIPPAKLKVR